MIEINLLPEELRVAAKKHDGFNPKYLLLLIPFVFALLLLCHVVLTMIGAIALSRNALLNKKWQGLSPSMHSVENFRREQEAQSSVTKVTEQLLSQRIDWAEKLNKLSLLLPNGMWFDGFTASPKELSLMGSVVSLSREHMGLINTFMTQLKQDKGFFRDFTSIELGSVQQQEMGSYEVVKFSLSGKLKGRDKQQR
jgi:Tfp pilus assembly protein PilN